MIEKGDVITIRIPYPSTDSGLAYRAHMYICLERSENKYRLAKCQTNKVELDEVMNRWIVEEANPERNPFRRTTRIDCDKVFEITDVIMPDSLRAMAGVSDDVLSAIEAEYAGTSPETINIDTTTLMSLNREIQQSQKDDEHDDQQAQACNNDTVSDLPSDESTDAPDALIQKSEAETEHIYTNGTITFRIEKK